MMAGHSELAFGVVCCQACRERAEGADLCRACKHNLLRARELRRTFEAMQRWEAIAEAGKLRIAELERYREGQVLLRREAQAEKAVAEHELVEMRNYATTLEDQITDLGLRVSELENELDLERLDG